ncbi:MAG TPA: RiPP maturation radical SAM C-methyltransferase, partial [Longimicrobiaceae bacterium]|nr:RiPP maturation radical SAM C-methyltransferase [Longimicrobiaceae bacterium]
GVDFVFSGPALRSFPELVRRLLRGDTAGCHRIDGVFSRQNRVREAGCTPAGPPQPDGPPAVRALGEEADINELLELDYEPFLEAFETRFPGLEKPRLFFETSRGCWWGERAHCTFCGLNGSTIHFRELRPELAIRHLDSLFRHAGRVSQLSAVDNILPRGYLREVLPYLDTPEGVSLFYEVKADLDEDDLRVLARAGVRRVQPGIEALNTSTLKLMRKGTSAFQNLRFLAHCLRYGVKPYWNLLIGFPGEEAAVYRKYLADLPLLTHLPPPQGVFPVRFDRFSPYHEHAGEYGLVLKPLDWYALAYPFPADALAELAYYFADHDYEAEYAFAASRALPPLRREVERWNALWADPARRPRLELRRHRGAAFVFDSRTGAPVEYGLGEGAARVLAALATPGKPASLAAELPDVEVDAELAVLRGKGLVFQEGERLLGLPVPPPAGAGEGSTRAAVLRSQAKVLL